LMSSMNLMAKTTANENSTSWCRIGNPAGAVAICVGI
jgi:hypothetical protein